MAIVAVVPKALGTVEYGYWPVSYTHLDVYKRQEMASQGRCLYCCVLGLRGANERISRSGKDHDWRYPRQYHSAARRQYVRRDPTYSKGV